MSLENLKGLGPKSHEMLLRVGIESAEDFHAEDPFELYRRMIEAGVPANLNLLYAMIGAQEDQHWQEIKQTRKTEILFRLDDMGLAPKK
jgi:DNA transformation protein